MKAGGFTKVTEKDLYTSEPPPQWFGNPENEKGAGGAHWTNTNWLKSRFHFSFAEYSNARRYDAPLPSSRWSFAFDV
jgi:hypothetical protein